MRNINEFNIPAGNSHGYEILYFGVNLILMLNYRLSFDVEVKNSNKEIQVLIFSRKDVPAWKENNNSTSSLPHTIAARVQESMMSLGLLQVMHMHLVIILMIT